jgi:hypothetical protein
MNDFFPFIHKIEKKKKEELQPLYIELDPPPQEQKHKSDDEETPRVIVIELM